MRVLPTGEKFCAGFAIETAPTSYQKLLDRSINLILRCADLFTRKLPVKKLCDERHNFSENPMPYFFLGVGLEAALDFLSVGSKNPANFAVVFLPEIGRHVVSSHTCPSTSSWIVNSLAASVSFSFIGMKNWTTPECFSNRLPKSGSLSMIFGF